MGLCIEHAMAIDLTDASTGKQIHHNICLQDPEHTTLVNDPISFSAIFLCRT